MSLACCTVALAQSDALNLESLWRHGQYNLARQLIQANVQAGNQGVDFLRDAAQAAFEMQDYATAASLYGKLADQTTSDLEAYRQARFRSWQSAWLTANRSPDAAWVASAQAEVAQRLSQPALRTTSDHQLALELEYLLATLLAGQAEPGSELRQGYPRSEVVLQAAKGRIDSVGTERDDAKRLALIAAFLEDYPKCYWRHVAYRYWLYTAWRQGNHEELRKAAGAYLKEYPDHPASLGAVSRYYFDAAIEGQVGRQMAGRSVELYETALGGQRTAAGLARLHEATRGEPPAPDYATPGQRAVFLEYLGSLFNLARYQMAQGDASGALKLVEPVISVDPFTLDEEDTLAPFYLVAGQAAEANGDLDQAYRDYLGAVVAGDSLNRYALQAEARLGELEGKVLARAKEQARMSYLPAELAQVRLPSFKDVTVEVGLGGKHGSRVAWGDVDGDGDPDLLVDGSMILRNDGPDGFSDVTRLWGLRAGKTAGLFADVDNDGDLDVYTLAAGAQGDRLWRNEGNHFVDITAVAGGVADDADSEAAAWLDFNADGWIDLFVANCAERPGQDAGPRTDGAPGRLYINKNGTYFALADRAACGMTPPFGKEQNGASVAACDFNNDGWADLALGNYFLEENALWANQGNGTVANLGRMTGLAGYSVDGYFGSTLGIDWGDFDNDGDFDLFCANIVDPRFEYCANKSRLEVAGYQPGSWEYTDRRAQSGIKYQRAIADPTWLDCNNDGWLDLYLTQAYPNSRSVLYVNDGQGGFHDVTYLAGAGVLGGMGCAWADYDGDGDLDLAVGAGQGLRLLRNDSSGPWLEVRLSGGMSQKEARAAAGGWSNAAAIGARITVATGSMTQIRELQSGKGLASGNQLIAHFGLPSASELVTVTIRFPSGRILTQEGVTPNQILNLSELQAGPTETQGVAVPGIEQPAKPGAPQDGTKSNGKADESGTGLERPKDTRR